MKRLSCWRRASSLLALAGFFSTSMMVIADPAILLSETLCQNQRDAIDYRWKEKNLENAKMFYISGNSTETGAIYPVGHEESFNSSVDVYTVIHGGVDSVAEFSGTDFAAVFLANHAATPENVTMYTCQAGTVPPEGGYSSMAKLARSYPGEGTNSTAIETVASPQPEEDCSLRASPTEDPYIAIDKLEDAVARSNVGHIDGFDEILARLIAGWDSVDVPYPGTTDSFQDYCEGRRVADPTGTWASDFVDAVNTQFGDDYLALINTNYGGNEFAVCGAQVGTENVQCN